MNSGKVAYASLISSLPPHPLSLWQINYKPVSRIQLEKRLNVLTPQDAKLLAEIEARLHWSKMTNQAEIIANKALTIDNVLLNKAVQWRLDLRLIMVALRQKQSGVETADLPSNELSRFIIQNWQADDFGLSIRFTWVKQAAQLLANHQALALEKLVLNISWQYYTTLAQSHYFDIEAVIIYVLRWDIVHRWQQYDESLAMRQFDKLVDNALGDFLAID